MTPRSNMDNRPLKERAAALGIQADLIDDEFMKCLNLAQDLLQSILPFVLTKINRVSFGLLRPEEIERFLANDPKVCCCVELRCCCVNRFIVRSAVLSRRAQTRARYMRFAELFMLTQSI